MTIPSRTASFGGRIAAPCAALALLASCQKSSLPPLADDAEVAASKESAGQPLTIAETAPLRVAPRSIFIDGRFEDWQGLKPVAQGHSTYEGSPYIRLGRVWCTFDNEWVYFRVDLGRVVNLQGLTGTLSLQLDADGNRMTGDIRTGGADQVGIAGVDFEIHFSPRQAGGGFIGTSAEIVESALPVAPGNPYWFDASFAPSYASREVELRLGRGEMIPGATVTPFAGASFAARFIFTDEVGSIIDRTEPFSIALPPLPPPTPMAIEEAPDTQETPAAAEPTPDAPDAPDAADAAAPDSAEVGAADDGDAAGGEMAEAQASGEGGEGGEAPAQRAQPAPPQPARAATRTVARVDRGDARAVTWNVLEGSIFNQPEPFVRVLRALDPDILCLQELGENATADLLRSWLDEHLPTTFGWEVMISADHDTAVASRLSAVPVTSISGQDDPQTPRVRAASLLVAAANRRVLVTSVHFTCCGRAGDERDQKRVQEANGVRRLLRAGQYDLNPSGLLVMGDLNLVGSDEPMQIVTFQNDLNGTNLRAAVPFVQGDFTTATWRDPEQPFLPARLDYAFISDSVFRITRSFVFDAARLTEAQREAYGVEADDSLVSDHLPMVVDFH